jgi:hypothetical protein
MDQLLTDLVANNHQINQCFNYRLFVNDNIVGKQRKLAFNSYENEASDDYDLPEPHVFNTDYQVPNTVFLEDETTQNSMLKTVSTLNNSYLSSQLQLKDERDVEEDWSSQNRYDSNNNLVKASQSAYGSRTKPVGKVRKYVVNKSTHSNYLNEFGRSSNSGWQSVVKVHSCEKVNPKKVKHSKQQARSGGSMKRVKSHQSKKNVTLMSNASSVTSTVIKCCMRPFKNLIFSSKKKLSCK